MRKSALLAATVLIIMNLIWGSAVIAEDEMCVPMGEIALEPISAKPERSEVYFPHAEHFGYNCQVCHHTWDKTTPIVGCTTSGCHDLAEPPITNGNRPVKDPLVQIQYFRNAFHELCIGCHKDIKKQNRATEASKLALGEKLSPAGPTSCLACHPKE